MKTKDACVLLTLAFSLAFFGRILHSQTGASVQSEARRLPLMIYDTGLVSIGITGLFGGSGVNTDQFLGVRFQSLGNFVTTEVGAHLGARPGDTLFAAIVELDSSTDLPDSPDLSAQDVLGHTVFALPSVDAGPIPSDVFWVPLSVRLKKNEWYALVFGSGLFSSLGSGWMPHEGITVNTQANSFSYRVTENRYYEVNSTLGYFGVRGMYGKGKINP